MKAKGSRDKGAHWERQVAAIVGGKRGRAFSGEPDVSTESYIFEVKVRKSLPKYILDAWAAAEHKAIGTRKNPIVVIGQSRLGRKPILFFCHVGAEEWVAEHGRGESDA